MGMCAERLWSHGYPETEGIPSPHASGVVRGGLGPSASTAQQEVVGGWAPGSSTLNRGSFLIAPSGKFEV